LVQFDCRGQLKIGRPTAGTYIGRGWKSFGFFLKMVLAQGCCRRCCDLEFHCKTNKSICCNRRSLMPPGVGTQLDLFGQPELSISFGARSEGHSDALLGVIFRVAGWGTGRPAETSASEHR
jgi:hypothetical protein